MMVRNTELYIYTKGEKEIVAWTKLKDGKYIDYITGDVYDEDYLEEVDVETFEETVEPIIN